ncbi:unnamed protein product [Meganyctiphanes norvegica]|uniref:Reelin domain-containing protein n=1 Tax=Meganyctiphanes norvegica TaxID=48144 RepID=A0AAV2PKZ3_MEGNR
MFLLALVMGFLGCIDVSSGFPDGAPIEACILPQPNRPNHAGTKPLPPHLAPYSFTASSDSYAPGQPISVQISGGPFKGFFVQARDAITNDWIGEWVQQDNNKVFPECSAVTHTHPGSKNKVSLTWRAPHGAGSGKVYFIGTILEKYDRYWSDMKAQVGPRRSGNRSPISPFNF